MNAALVWFQRIVSLLPLVQNLWTAIDTNDEGAEMEASLALRQHIAEEQMREKLKV